MGDCKGKFQIVRLVPVEIRVVHCPKVSLAKNLFLEKEENETVYGTPKICIPDTQYSNDNK